MRYGRIHIEDGIIHFSSHMIVNSVPISDIVWAYHRQVGNSESESVRTLVTNHLVLVTNRGRSFEFTMSEREAKDCLQFLKACNSSIAINSPRGGRILLQNLPNTRDLGGIKTADGGHIMPGKLLPSGELYHPSSHDKEVLMDEYEVHTVIDLRSATERRHRPDDPLEGIEYYPIPLLDEDTHGCFDELTLMDQIGALKGDPRDDVLNQYIKILNDPYSIGQIARVIESIRKNEEGAVLWHCNTGKDRTAIITAILLYILGVDREDILKDYLRCNLYLAMEKEYALELMVANGFARENIEARVKALFEVEESYLEAAFRTIEENYGSVNRFLKRGLYLTPKAIEDLRWKYLI